MMKAFNGAFRGVSVALAQERSAVESIEITSKQEGMRHREEIRSLMSAGEIVPIDAMEKPSMHDNRR